MTYPEVWAPRVIAGLSVIVIFGGCNLDPWGFGARPVISGRGETGAMALLYRIHHPITYLIRSSHLSLNQLY